MRRIGWLLLAGLGGLLFALTAVGTAWRVGTALSDSNVGGALSAGMFGGLTLVFWWWITLGSWARYRPPINPATGEPEPLEPIGPWGVVGRILMVAVVLGVVVGGFVLYRMDRQATERADAVRSRAVAHARRTGITFDQVVEARDRGVLWATDGEGPAPIDQLLGVDGATIATYRVDDDHATVWLRPDGGAPCAVVIIDDHDLITSAVSSRCS